MNQIRASRAIYFLLPIAVFISCTTGGSFVSKDETELKGDTDTLNIENEIGQPYLVVREDYVDDWLQRIFIQLDTEIVKDSVEMQVIICNIEKQYLLNNGLNISFFKDSSFADYFDNILARHPEVSRASVQDRLLFKEVFSNEQYIGEFDSEDFSIELFPSSDIEYSKYFLSRCPQYKEGDNSE